MLYKMSVLVFGRFCQPTRLSRVLLLSLADRVFCKTSISPTAALNPTMSWHSEQSFHSKKQSIILLVTGLWVTVAHRNMLGNRFHVPNQTEGLTVVIRRWPLETTCCNLLVSSPARGTYHSITCSLAANDIVPLRLWFTGTELWTRAASLRSTPELFATSNDLQNHNTTEDFHLNKPHILSESMVL